MTTQTERLQALVAPGVAALGYELVGVEYVSHERSAFLRLFIDSPDGITVDDCERVSRQVSSLLDVADPIPGNYRLEVSSPGIERPLFAPEHYRRYIGERVRIRLHVPQEGRRRLVGVLKGCEDGVVTVEEDGREWQLPLETISRANLAPEDIPIK